MKGLVIGAGEVGTAVYKIAKDHFPTFIRDIDEINEKGFGILHICYPFSSKFVEITKEYIERYDPLVTVVHSSIEVGTTDRLGSHVVYSPVRGRHPNLEREIKIYRKFVSGRSSHDVGIVAEYFRKCGLKVHTDFNPITVELSKLLSNIHMGIEIAWRQEVERIMRKFYADSSVYESWEESYRDGYEILEHKNLIRSHMKPDPIGGHCILPCTNILREQFPSKILDFIVESNNEVLREKHGLAKRRTTEEIKHFAGTNGNQ